LLINKKTSSNPARSRVNSVTSVSSVTSVIFSNYSTPQRKYYPPSDIESDFEVESVSSETSPNQLSPNNSNDIKKLNKLLDIYKNKFNQLKMAYDEAETEKEKIKVNTLLFD
jgi:hypothetical protein